MKMVKRLLTAGWICTWIIAGWVTLAAAGIYWESSQTSQGMPGQKDGSKTLKSYLSENGSRVESEGSIMVFNIKNGTMYQIDPQTQTYSEMSLQALADQMSAMDEGASAAMQKMMGSPEVVPTQETRTINGYKCKKFMVNFMMAESEYWVSADIPAAREAQELGRKMADALSQNPMLKQMNLAAMLADLGGFPVETIVKMMGGQMKTTLTKIEQKKLAENLFTVPKGYKKVAPAQ